MKTGFRWLLGIALVLAAVAVGRADHGARSVGSLQSPGAGGAGQGAALERRRAHLVGIGLDPERVDRAIEACRVAGFGTGETDRLLSLVARAHLAGLPYQNLLNKLQEGVAKGAEPEAIENALNRRATVLNKAKAIVDRLLVEGWAAPDYGLAIGMVADALTAGARSGAILRAVRQGTPLAPGVPDVTRVFQAPAAGR